MRTSVLLALALLNSGAVVSASVPCAVFGNSSGCPNPIVQGVVDGQWVGLIYHFDGTNGGPNTIGVVVVGGGGNGYSTTALQVIEPEGQYGDRMDAHFVDGKLWVENAEFGFHGKRLAVEETASVPTDATQVQIRAALSTASLPLSLFSAMASFYDRAPKQDCRRY
jgi:hypothetical protein